MESVHILPDETCMESLLSPAELLQEVTISDPTNPKSLPSELNEIPANVDFAVILSDAEEDIIPNPVNPANPANPGLILLKAASETDPEAPDSTHDYFQLLSQYRVLMSESESTNPLILSPPALSRITKEMKTLIKSLPCEPSSAMFCSFCSKNLGELRTLISGPEETPYENGLYHFNVSLPTDYPAAPPSVNILTTGGGLLRFNPNLYNDGFVCLSVINTWQGNPEEMWNPEHSSLLQVFLSIQALVMDSMIVQKEPGYEYLLEKAPENVAYTWVVRYGNMAYAMLEQLKNPPAEFQEVVFRHFSLRRQRILETCQRWVEESNGAVIEPGSRLVHSHNSRTLQLFTEKGAYNAFSELFEELKVELEKLPVYSL